MAFALGLGLSVVVLILWHVPILNGHKQLQLNAPLIVATLVNYLPILAVLVFMLPWTAGRSFGELGLRVPRASDVFAAIIGAAAAELVTIVAGVLEKFVFHIDGIAKDIQLFNSSHDPVIVVLFVIIAVAIAPLIEELVFRGFLFNALLRWMPVGFAMTIASVLFSLAHGDLVASFPLACVGFVLCAVYYRTGSLTASIGTHALFNLMNVALVMLGGAKHP